MPSTTVFDRQDQSYQDSVLPPTLTRRIAIEAGITEFWWRYVGSQGKVLGVDQFGESAPAPQIYAHLNLTVDNIVGHVNDIL
ncbi:MAG: hypothetical protein HKN70_14365 [Gammaproteobacteria bacterium]|nr:hypothetical protein [Gammaproteobacteria bacterium]